jgi:branched-chain amino acid aminotransferase
VIALLRKAGIAVYERTLDYQDLLDADEIFSSGNFGKVMPYTKIDNRALQPGPIFRRARELYWEFAHS